MINIDFSVQDIVPRNNGNEYVLLQAGKGNAKYTKIYVNKVGFSYLEGLIWDKFREFNRVKVTKIQSNDFKRILDGFRNTANLLKDDLDESILQDILKFNVIRPKFDLQKARENYYDFHNMFIEITEWLSKVVLKEKYVLIQY